MLERFGGEDIGGLRRTETIYRIETVELEGTVSDDPTPDLADIAPSGNRIFVTLRGPTVSFSHDTWICVPARSGTGLDAGTPMLAKAGGPVALGCLEREARGYLCVQGGLRVPSVMGSAATLVRAGTLTRRLWPAAAMVSRRAAGMSRA